MFGLSLPVDGPWFDCYVDLVLSRICWHLVLVAIIKSQDNVFVVIVFYNNSAKINILKVLNGLNIYWHNFTLVYTLGLIITTYN